MKILSIEDVGSCHFDGKFENGVMKASRDIIEVMASKGHEVYSFCPTGGDLVPDNWTIKESSMVSKGRHEGKRYSALTYTKEAVQYIREIVPELIICHANRSDTVIKYLIPFTIPKMIIVHGLPIGGPEQFAIVNLYRRFIASGGNVVAVSDYCKSLWDKQYLDLEMHGEQGTPVISDSFCFQRAKSI